MSEERTLELFNYGHRIALSDRNDMLRIETYSRKGNEYFLLKTKEGSFLEHKNESFLRYVIQKLELIEKVTIGKNQSLISMELPVDLLSAWSVIEQIFDSAFIHYQDAHIYHFILDDWTLAPSKNMPIEVWRNDLKPIFDFFKEHNLKYPYFNYPDPEANSDDIRTNALDVLFDDITEIKNEITFILESFEKASRFVLNALYTTSNSFLIGLLLLSKKIQKHQWIEMSLKAGEAHPDTIEGMVYSEYKNTYELQYRELIELETIAEIFNNKPPSIVYSEIPFLEDLPPYASNNLLSALNILSKPGEKNLTKAVLLATKAFECTLKEMYFDKYWNSHAPYSVERDEEFRIKESKRIKDENSITKIKNGKKEKATPTLTEFKITSKLPPHLTLGAMKQIIYLLKDKKHKNLPIFIEFSNFIDRFGVLELFHDSGFKKDLDYITKNRNESAHSQLEDLYEDFDIHKARETFDLTIRNIEKLINRS